MKNHFGNFIIAVAVVISAGLLGRAWIKTHQSRNVIQVTGLSSKEFTSDLIVWNASFSKKANNLKDAYALLKIDADIIKQYLVEKGLKEQDFVFSAVSINKEYDYIRNPDNTERQVFTGYNLIQSVKIESKEVDKIENISREVTDLINKGIELYSDSPQYFYTKLSELKIEMLAAASADARQRAEKIAESAKGSVDDLKYADMGVFQITAPNSTEDYTWGGAFNTISKRKVASITVKLEFSIK